jgi:hypothetical protein
VLGGIMHVVRDAFGLELMCSLFEATFRTYAPVHPRTRTMADWNGRKGNGTAIRAASEESVMQQDGKSSARSHRSHDDCVRNHATPTATDLSASTSSGILALVAEKVLPLDCALKRSLAWLYQAAGTLVVTVQPKSTAAAQALDRLSSAMWAEAEFAGEVRHVAERAKRGASGWLAVGAVPTYDFQGAAQNAKAEAGGGSGAGRAS